MADNIKSFIKVPDTINCNAVGFVETKLGDETFHILTVKPEVDGVVFLQSPELTAQCVAVHPYGAIIYNDSVTITDYNVEALFAGEVYIGGISLDGFTLTKFNPEPPV